MRDHPRIRGEHFLRGPGLRPARWIIPAYAGSTPTFTGLLLSEQDHPRIRGEHIDTDRPGAAGTGSSPHTRGAPDNERNRRINDMDHPRIRGEHFEVGVGQVLDGGSSPHTRGAPHFSFPFQFRERIIPAYAGSTPVPGAFLPCCTDHPRIRGEHATVPLRLPGGAGSSPHTRGARPGHPRSSQPARIIPAYAGSTGVCP